MLTINIACTCIFKSYGSILLHTITDHVTSRVVFRFTQLDASQLQRLTRQLSSFLAQTTPQLKLDIGKFFGHLRVGDATRLSSVRCKTHQQTHITTWSFVIMHKYTTTQSSSATWSRAGEQPRRKLLVGVCCALSHSLALVLMVAYLCEDVVNLGFSLPMTEASWTLSKHCKTYKKLRKVNDVSM